MVQKSGYSNQLRLVVDLPLFRRFYTSQVVQDFLHQLSSIYILSIIYLIAGWNSWSNNIHHSMSSMKNTSLRLIISACLFMCFKTTPPKHRLWSFQKPLKHKTPVLSVSPEMALWISRDVFEKETIHLQYSSILERTSSCSILPIWISFWEIFSLRRIICFQNDSVEYLLWYYWINFGYHSEGEFHDWYFLYNIISWECTWPSKNTTSKNNISDILSPKCLLPAIPLGVWLLWK